ncbi:hypothetical protein RD055328_13690 [Companilactobacillus sp. RD055328]|uniref:DUF871 domain-containing protein n=1 Tax=Companilactobacillus sp. RD055328 TaxID=2916634 RepID=UPI001FC87541|nr:MupG family TIM beta-alpha barrel fold protein [Companilactobacillus sp. RD055328]GKQ43446.1 hypothetical protein RD055328_13690 [Companilactobacillus sp. RD055328]
MLGISIYPTKSSIEDTINYIDLASSLGYRRIFTSMLEVTKENKNEMIDTFTKVIHHAKDKGMYVSLDVNPRSFDVLGIDYFHLQLLEDMGASAIRLDANFDGMTESLISFGDTNLNIELNISSDTKIIENIISFKSNMRKLSGCHNFYPQRYTGLDFDFFIKCSKMYKDMGLKNAAFVNSQAANIGPHAYDEGLPTLEMHRDWDIVTQAKHLFATGLIDDVIIGNAFASEEELKALAKVNADQIEFNAIYEELTEYESDILFNHQHFNRGDINSYSIRSTFVKLEYKDKSIPAHLTPTELHRGDITIGNDSFGQYKGEVNIVKKDIPNNGGLKNVVGHISDEELFLIDYIKPWSKFKFNK